MNNMEQKSNTPIEITREKKLEIFRDEMRRIKEIEMNKKQAWEERGETGETYNPHFDGINPDYLGEAEREVYEKYQNDDLNADAFNELKRLAMEKYNKLPVNISEKEHRTIADFWAYMANRVSAREGRRQLEELRQKKAGKIF